MPDFSRLLLPFKALRELGPAPLALDALYRFGLASGHYARTVQPPAPVEGLQIRELFAFPAREALRAVLGPAGQAKLLAEADEIVGGQVRLFGDEPLELKLDPGGPLAHWSAYETGAIQSYGDIKFIWEPARFGWAFVLGRAYHLNGDERYAEAFWRFFERFQAANPPYRGPNWMSAQEVGFRLMAFIWAAGIFARSDQSTPARLAALAASTAVHAARIPPTLVYARAQNNNHLLSEAAALYTAGLALPAHPDAPAWRAAGEKWLRWCLLNQIDTYGNYVQHSTNYQRLMLQVALWAHLLLERLHELNPETLDEASWLNDKARENLALATHWLLSLLDPDSGRVPNLGANDGAQVFPFSTCNFSDFRPVVQAAARAFMGYSLASGPWNEAALWFGLPHVESEFDPPRYRGDHLYAPNSWGYLRAVKFSTRPSHADQLHFDLWWRGFNIAQDAGTYRYNAAPPWDNRLTSTLVHNTVTLDAQEQMTRAGRFLYLDWARAISKRHFDTDGDFLERVSAQTDAYRRFGVRHERTVSAYAEDRWRVDDELVHVMIPGKVHGSHVFRLHWLLPDWEYSLDGATLRLKTPRGWMTLSVSSGLPFKRVGLVRAGELVQGDGLLDPTFGWVSPTYGVKRPALSFAIEVESVETVQFTSKFDFPK